MYAGSDRWGDYDSDYVVGASVFAEQCTPQQAMVMPGSNSPHEPPSILSLDEHNPHIDCR